MSLYGSKSDGSADDENAASDVTIICSKITFLCVDFSFESF